MEVPERLLVALPRPWARPDPLDFIWNKKLRFCSFYGVMNRAADARPIDRVAHAAD